jgi:hypothetical protein
MLTFEPEQHIYKWNGIAVPSVTQVIGEWKLINVYGGEYYCNVFTGAVIGAEKLREVAKFGTAVHKVALITLSGGKVNREALHPRLLNPLNQLELWKETFRPEITCLERPMYSASMSVAGTADIFFQTKNKLIICDIKTGAYDMAGPQTAAYAELYREENKCRTKHIRRYVLHLPADGQYQFIPMTAPEDYIFFRARLTQYNLLQGRRLTNGK